MNPRFTLWGFHNVDLLIDAPVEGPSRAQEEAFRRFQMQRDFLLPRCIHQVSIVREGLEVPDAAFVISGLTIPSLTLKRNGRLWTLWFDLEGDHQFTYGVHTEDDWKTILAFADD